ncbi:MAG: hypothetical protein ISN64_03270 [Rickettsia sp.]|nr:hypothetical protein [Rickettsia sp.]
MLRFYCLLLHELKIQVKIHNLLLYFASFFLFVFIATSFVFGVNIEKLYIVKLFLIFIPISLMSIGSSTKEDFNTGQWEFLLTLFSPKEIMLSKYFAICTCHFAITLLNNAILFIFYNINLRLLMITLILSSFLVLLSVALFIFIVVMQFYFPKYKNYLLTLMFPFMIPSFLFISVLLDGTQIYYILSIIGTVMVFVPALLIASTFLIDNFKSISIS